MLTGDAHGNAHRECSQGMLSEEPLWRQSRRAGGSRTLPAGWTSERRGRGYQQEEEREQKGTQG